MTYLLNATSGVSCFKNDNRGSNRALRESLNMLVDSGELVKLSKEYMHKEFNSSAEAFGIGTAFE